MTVQDVLWLVAYGVLAFVLLWIGKRIFDLVGGSADAAIEDEGNLARGLHRGGIYLAITLGLYGVMVTPSPEGPGADFLATAVDGLVLIVLLLVAGMINDRVILRGIDDRAALAEGNLAVGLMGFATYVATGFIAMGAFRGEGGGMLSALVFFVLGQLALVLLVALYEKITPFPALAEIASGNAAAGLLVGSMVLALGVVLGASVAGDFAGWTPDLISFATSAAIGIAGLLLALKPIDWILLPNTDFETEIVRDRNVAAIAVAGSVQVAVALVIASVFL